MPFERKNYTYVKVRYFFQIMFSIIIIFYIIKILQIIRIQIIDGIYINSTLETFVHKHVLAVSSERISYVKI